MTEADATALSLLADVYDEYLTLRSFINKHGRTLETVSTMGNPIIKNRPEAALMNDAWKRAKSMLTEFGLTPSSRTGVSVVQKTEADPLDKLLKGLN
jgi:P27 family predicted phage terminase small subunit